MEIKDYITKNLPNLNWNILPQIFESEGVELTEEIERYLRETPKNTNWNVFGSLGSENAIKILIDETATFGQDPDGDYRYYYTQPWINYTWDYIPSKITLVFDEETYENIEIFVTETSTSISGGGTAEDGLFTFDFSYNKTTNIGHLILGVQQTGYTHHIIIYDIGEN